MLNLLKLLAGILGAKVYILQLLSCLLSEELKITNSNNLRKLF